MHDTTPTTVMLLGYGGLIPFVGLTAVWLSGASGAERALYALIMYGAVILSFVGAIHWGLAMADPLRHAPHTSWRYAWSVMPSLMGWTATLLSPVGAASVLVLGFALHYWQDHRWHARSTLPAWYLPMRRRLSVVACLCLVAAAAHTTSG